MKYLRLFLTFVLFLSTICEDNLYCFSNMSNLRHPIFCKRLRFMTAKVALFSQIQNPKKRSFFPPLFKNKCKKRIRLGACKFGYCRGCYALKTGIYFRYSYRFAIDGWRWSGEAHVKLYAWLLYLRLGRYFANI